MRTFAMATLLLSSFAGRVLPSTPLVALALLLAILNIFLYRAGVDKVYVSLSAIVATSWVFFTVLWSILPPITARRALSFATVSIAATMLGTISPSMNVRSGIRLACQITIGFSLIAAVFLPSWAISPDGQTEVGLQGIAFQKNQLGFIACVGLAAEGLAAPSRSRKLWFAAYIIAVSLSRSSTAIAVMLLVVAFLAIIRGIRSIHDRATKVVFTSLMAAPGVVTLVMVFVAPGALAGLFGKDAGLTGRNVIWATVWSYIKERPLLGYGWNTVWPTESGGFLPSEVAFETVRRAGFEVVNSHNGYLDIVLGGGVIALVIFLVIVVLAPGRTPFAQNSVWRTAVVLAFVVNSLSESNFSLGFVAVLFLLVASRRNESDLETSLRPAPPPVRPIEPSRSFPVEVPGSPSDKVVARDEQLDR